jgi:insertion element IS1 protein InsB
VLRAGLERCRMPGVARIFAMARQTVALWLKTHGRTITRCQRDPSACGSRRCPRSGCASGVVCRRKSTNGGCGQRCAAQHGRVWHSSSVIEAKRPVFVSGRRSRRSTNTAHGSRDCWHAYQHVFPAETHHCVGKETGETAHMERWNNTLPQRLGGYVRQTFSFSRVR